jgi:exo-1,4-beta-D-glucosaminidase
MFEAFAAKKYDATGVIQWMLNSAWPSVIWNLYDYYLRPGGGYFGTKKACEPLHIQYSYDDQSVIVVNSSYETFHELTARARVYDLDTRELYSNSAAVNIGADAVTRAFAIPAILQRTSPYFVSLYLNDASGREVSSNFYWLSQKPDVLDWEKGDAYYTPQNSFADFSDLKKLPPVKLEVSASYKSEGPEGVARVIVRNPGSNLAFFIHLEVVNGDNSEELLPVRWEDNFFSLLPGERRTVTAKYAKWNSRHVKPVVRLDGWNVTKTVR